MAKNPLIRRNTAPKNFKNQAKSKGILDDHAVRKNIATREGTIEKVPVNDSDITNKKYVDDSIPATYWSRGITPPAGYRLYPTTVTDTIGMGDGSLTFAGIHFTSDFNTGMIRPADDALGFVAGGVEGLRITESAGAIASTFTGTLSVPDLTTGSIPFIGASGLVSEDNSDLFWDDTNKRFGVGTAIPTHLITGVYEGGRAVLGLATYTDTHGTPSVLGAQVTMTTAGGTEASPTTVADDWRIGALNFGAHEGTNFQYSATVKAYVDGTPSAGVVPMRLSFETGPSSSGFRKERLKVLSNGDVDIVNNATNAVSNITTYSDTTGHYPRLYFRKSHNDTVDTMTATIDNSVLGVLWFQGVGSSVPSFDNSAYIRVDQDGAAGTTKVPTEIKFGTSPGGSTSPSDRLTIKPDGAINIVILQSGSTQANAGAAAGELWKTSGHASLPNNVVMHGV